MSPTLRKPTADRRMEIAQAVLRIIGERGQTSLSTATIAAEVGVTTGALYRHFASLDEILTETVRQGVLEIDRTFPDPALPPGERLLALARNRVRLLGSRPGLIWLLRSEQAHLTLPPDAVALLQDVVRRSRAFLLGALREGAAAGSFRGDIAPELLLVPVVATIHAAIGNSGAHARGARGSRPDPEQVLQTLVRLIEAPATPPRRRAPGPRSKQRPITGKETAR